LNSRVYEILGWSFKTAETFDSLPESARPPDARFSLWKEAPGEWSAEPEWYHFAYASGGRAWPAFGRTPGGYVLHFEGAAAFGFTRDGREVDAIAHPGAGWEIVQRLFLDQVVPLVLTLRRRDCLHASAVDAGGSALAFVGASGAGKSTLAAALAHHGAPLLCDDCLALMEHDGRFSIYPGHAASKLWRDSAAALASAAPAAPRPVAGHDGKLWHGLAPAARAALPLRALYLVDPAGPGEAFTITPALPGQSVAALLAAAFRLELNDADELARQFQLLMRLAATVPVFHLGYAHDFSTLPSLCRALLDHQRALATT
jgi:hypothetical protein